MVLEDQYVERLLCTSTRVLGDPLFLVSQDATHSVPWGSRVRELVYFMEAGREAGGEGGREGGREGARERGREGGREAGRQGGREAGGERGAQISPY